MMRRFTQANFCPECSAPLTGSGQCIMPECKTHNLCGVCKERLDIYGHCVNNTCMRYDPKEEPAITHWNDLLDEETIVGISCPRCEIPLKTLEESCLSCATDFRPPRHSKMVLREDSVPHDSVRIQHEIPLTDDDLLDLEDGWDQTSNS